MTFYLMLWGSKPLGQSVFSTIFYWTFAFSGDYPNIVDHVSLLELQHSVQSWGDQTKCWGWVPDRVSQPREVGEGGTSNAEGECTLKSFDGEWFSFKEGSFGSFQAIDFVLVVLLSHFLDKLNLSIMNPAKVFSLNIEGELLMVSQGSVLHLVHLVELSLEHYELSAFWAV